MKMQKVTDSFELPKDIVLGLPIVTAYGYNELTIENHKGVLSFSDKAVTVRAADSTIKISGRKPSFSPASIAGRVRIIRPTCSFLNAVMAIAMAR